MQEKKKIDFFQKKQVFTSWKKRLRMHCAIRKLQIALKIPETDRTFALRKSFDIWNEHSTKFVSRNSFFSHVLLTILQYQKKR